MASPEDDDDLIPDSGAVFTFGRSRFADNLANKFWIKNDSIVQISCGDEHSAVVTERGRLYVFGSNDWGQLGLGHKKPTNKPSFVKVLKPEKIIQVACGRTHTIVSTASQKLYSFGGNEDGQLGHGDKNNETFPKVLDALSSVIIKEISCGAYHSITLTGDGEVYVWGLNSEGQLGIGMNDEETPLPVKLDVGESVISVSCGYYHTALVTRKGLLYTFGEDETGKLGLSGSQLDDTSLPQAVPALDSDSYIQVSCGARHTVAVTKKGLCYSWGDGSHGQLGHGTMCQEVSSPKLIELLSKHKVVQVSCGDSHTAVVTDNGKIFTFGDGRHGKLGQGDECFSNLFKPTIINRFREFHVNSVSCGGCHMLVRAVHATSKESDKEEEEEDSLLSSMRSEYSIKEANMTLKPGNMTFPTVSPRDKRRHKEDKALSQSVNLNGSLNSSLTMAQLNRRELPQLPASFDRSKLPKIPGMLPAKKNSLEEVKGRKKSNEEQPTEKQSTDDDVKTKKNKRLVAEISFSRNEPVEAKKVETVATNRPVPPIRKRIDKNIDAAKDIDLNENLNGTQNRSKNNDFVNQKNKKNKALSSSNRDDNDDDEDDEDSTYESDEPTTNINRTNHHNTKNVVGVKKKPKDADSGEDEEMDEEEDESEYETESEEEPSPVNKSNKKSLNKRVQEESEEDEDEVDGTRGASKLNRIKNIHSTPKPTKMLVKQKKRVEEEEEEEEEETEYETEEDEEEEEESEEEIPVKKSKGKFKGKEPKKVEKINKRKKNDKKKKKQIEEEEEDDDDEAEEEDDEEDEEEEQDEDEEDGDDRTKGKNKKNNSKSKETNKEKNGKKKNKKEDKTNKKKKKKKEEEEEEEEEDDDDEEVDDDEEEDNDDKSKTKDGEASTKDEEKNKVEEQKSGGFFPQTKQKAAPAKETGSESKPGSPTNDAQRSKACVIL